MQSITSSWQISSSGAGVGPSVPQKSGKSRPSCSKVQQPHSNESSLLSLGSLSSSTHRVSNLWMVPLLDLRVMQTGTRRVSGLGEDPVLELLDEPVLGQESFHAPHVCAVTLMVGPTHHKQRYARTGSFIAFTGKAAKRWEWENLVVVLCEGRSLIGQQVAVGFDRQTRGGNSFFGGYRVTSLL